MAAETTNTYNKVQLALVIRWVDDVFNINEYCLGMHTLLSTTADSIIASIKDVLLNFVDAHSGVDLEFQKGGLFYLPKSGCGFLNLKCYIFKNNYLSYIFNWQKYPALHG